MHWSWRATIAAILTVIITTAFWMSVARIALGIPTQQYLKNVPSWPLVIQLLFSALPIGIYVLLTRAFNPQTRCRKCHYILRGITEPRCPECGERI